MILVSLVLAIFAGDVFGCDEQYVYDMDGTEVEFTRYGDIWHGGGYEMKRLGQYLETFSSGIREETALFNIRRNGGQVGSGVTWVIRSPENLERSGTMMASTAFDTNMQITFRNMTYETTTYSGFDGAFPDEHTCDFSTMLTKTFDELAAEIPCCVGAVEGMDCSTAAHDACRNGAMSLECLTAGTPRSTVFRPRYAVEHTPIQCMNWIRGTDCVPPTINAHFKTEDDLSHSMLHFNHYLKDGRDPYREYVAPFDFFNEQETECPPTLFTGSSWEHKEVVAPFEVLDDGTVYMVYAASVEARPFKLYTSWTPASGQAVQKSKSPSVTPTTSPPTVGPTKGPSGILTHENVCALGRVVPLDDSTGWNLPGDCPVGDERNRPRFLLSSNADDTELTYRYCSEAAGAGDYCRTCTVVVDENETILDRYCDAVDCLYFVGKEACEEHRCIWDGAGSECIEFGCKSDELRFDVIGATDGDGNSLVVGSVNGRFLYDREEHNVICVAPMEAGFYIETTVDGDIQESHNSSVTAFDVGTTQLMFEDGTVLTLSYSGPVTLPPTFIPTSLPTVSPISFWDDIGAVDGCDGFGPRSNWSCGCWTDGALCGGGKSGGCVWSSGVCTRNVMDGLCESYGYWECPLFRCQLQVNRSNYYMGIWQSIEIGCIEQYEDCYSIPVHQCHLIGTYFEKVNRTFEIVSSNGMGCHKSEYDGECSNQTMRPTSSPTTPLPTRTPTTLRPTREPIALSEIDHCTGRHVCPTGIDFGGTYCYQPEGSTGCVKCTNGEWSSFCDNAECSSFNEEDSCPCEWYDGKCERPVCSDGKELFQYIGQSFSCSSGQCDDYDLSASFLRFYLNADSGVKEFDIPNFHDGRPLYVCEELFYEDTIVFGAHGDPAGTRPLSHIDREDREGEFVVTLRFALGPHQFDVGLAFTAWKETKPPSGSPSGSPTAAPPTAVTPTAAPPTAAPPTQSQCDLYVLATDCVLDERCDW